MDHNFKEHCASALLIIICPPPVCHAQRIEWQRQRFLDSPTGVLEQTLENSGLYAAAAESVASELSLPCLNLWRAMQEEAPDDKWHTYLSDGLHLSPSGNEAVAKLLIDKIDSAAPDLALRRCLHTASTGNSGSCCDGLPHNGPWHDAIDYRNLTAAFQAHRISTSAAPGNPMGPCSFARAATAAPTWPVPSL